MILIISIFIHIYLKKIQNGYIYFIDSTLQAMSLHIYEKKIISAFFTRGSDNSTILLSLYQ